MPADNPACIYCDANVLLAYVGNEVGRVDVVETLLDEAGHNRIEIITSVLSIAEVAYGAEEKAAGLTDDGVRRIEKLWVPSSPITLVDVSSATARGARMLIRHARQQGLSLRSVDALHLASAMQFGATTIFTYETQKLASWALITGLVVTEPTVVNAQLDFGPPGSTPPG